jgi:N-acetyl-anhydromuramyl-L-alanine amidase AmpD
MKFPGIEIRTFQDYSPYVYDRNREERIVPNTHYPDYTYWAHDLPGSLVGPTSLIVHSMNIPEWASATGEVNVDVYDAKNFLELLQRSCHFFIPQDQEGTQESDDEKLVVYQMVQEDRKAWHAGVSRLPNLAEDEQPIGLNHTGLGVELMQAPGTEITELQYTTLAGLTSLVVSKFPIQNILGHNEVSGPDVREDFKEDPVNFDWERYMAILAQSLGVETEEIAHYRKRVS